MWTFEHTVECPVDKKIAWQFWTNVDNWAVVDPAVEAVTLHGAFAAGTTGTTKPRDMESVNWLLAEVQAGERAVIEIVAPGVSARFHMTFADTESGGTRITQRVSIERERADEYTAFGEELEMGIPHGMQRLAEAIEQAANEK
jgi:hypothetical protein